MQFCVRMCVCVCVQIELPQLFADHGTCYYIRHCAGIRLGQLMFRVKGKSFRDGRLRIT